MASARSVSACSKARSSQAICARRFFRIVGRALARRFFSVSISTSCSFLYKARTGARLAGARGTSSFPSLDGRARCDLRRGAGTVEWLAMPMASTVRRSVPTESQDGTSCAAKRGRSRRVSTPPEQRSPAIQAKTGLWEREKGTGSLFCEAITVERHEHVSSRGSDERPMACVRGKPCAWGEG